MSIPVVIALILLAIFLFVAVRKKWIDIQTLAILASIGTIIATIVSLVLFYVPLPASISHGESPSPTSLNVSEIFVPPQATAKFKVSVYDNPSESANVVAEIPVGGTAKILTKTDAGN